MRQPAGMQVKKSCHTQARVSTLAFQSQWRHICSFTSAAGMCVKQGTYIYVVARMRPLKISTITPHAVQACLWLVCRKPVQQAELLGCNHSHHCDTHSPQLSLHTASMTRVEGIYIMSLCVCVAVLATCSVCFVLHQPYD